MGSHLLPKRIKSQILASFMDSMTLNFAGFPLSTEQVGVSLFALVLPAKQNNREHTEYLCRHGDQESVKHTKVFF